MGFTSTFGCGCCGRAGAGGGGDGTAATVVRTAEEEKSGGVNPLLPLLLLLVVVTIAPAGLTVTLFCRSRIVYVTRYCLSALATEHNIRNY